MLRPTDPEPSGYVIWTRRLVMAIGVAMSLFHLYIGFSGPPNAFVLRSTHLGFALVLAFLSMPGLLRRRSSGPGVLDWAFAAVAIAASAYPIVESTYFNTRMVYVGPVSLTDMIFAWLMIVVVL